MCSVKKISSFVYSLSVLCMYTNNFLRVGIYHLIMFVGLTPLAQAVHCQQMAAVKRLVKMGADINAQDGLGRTCLCIASYQVSLLDPHT